jgi:hypothetical protein
MAHKVRRTLTKKPPKSAPRMRPLALGRVRRLSVDTRDLQRGQSGWRTQKGPKLAFRPSRQQKGAIKPLSFGRLLVNGDSFVIGGPEPSSIALAGLGLAVMMIYRRRKLKP